MDFERVLRVMIPAMEGAGVRYGISGGFAVGALGVPRATGDLDILVHREDLEKFDGVLEEVGYEVIHRGENVSRYDSTNPLLGSVDAIHAFRKASLGMLGRVRWIEVFEGTLRVPVLEPEDVIGLKVQAIANDPERTARDTADIEALAGLYRGGLDWDRLREYYALFDMEEVWRDLHDRFNDA